MVISNGLSKSGWIEGGAGLRLSTNGSGGAGWREQCSSSSFAKLELEGAVFSSSVAEIELVGAVFSCSVATGEEAEVLGQSDSWSSLNSSASKRFLCRMNIVASANDIQSLDTRMRRVVYPILLHCQKAAIRELQPLAK